MKSSLVLWCVVASGQYIPTKLKANGSKLNFMDMYTILISFDPIFMEDAQCAEMNEKSTFQFLFFELSWKIHRKLGTKITKNYHNSKNKIGKIWNMIFLSIQHILHLSCKFDQFWKKKLILMYACPGCFLTLEKKIDIFFLQKYLNNKKKKKKIWFFFRFSRFRNFHVNLNTFEEKKCQFFFGGVFWPPTKKHPGPGIFLKIGGP